ncbi:EAL and HDOD domain-containing protein [Acidisoma sp. 7E03]
MGWLNASRSRGKTEKPAGTHAPQPQGQRQFFLGRQPIVGRHRELVAFELLFRDRADGRAAGTDGFIATATVIQNAFASLGIERALGKRKGFINVDEDALMSDLVEILPPDRVVLEILKQVDFSPQVVERCAQLKAAGYALALDDVREMVTGYDSVLDHVDYVKVDIGALSFREMVDLVQRMRRLGIGTVAQKVETVEQYEDCKSIGFDLFQGYFFARPSIIAGREVQQSKMSLIRILRLLAHDADNQALEDALKEVPDLAVRLLTMASAAANARTSRVNSLREAVFLLGRQRIGRIIQLLLVAQSDESHISSDPLIQIAAIRGRFMEGLAEFIGKPALRDEAFMVGILSLADSIFGQSMTELMEVLTLDERLKAALLRREGDLGELLTLAEASEASDPAGFNRISKMLESRDPALFNRMQMDAIHWASTL